MCSPIATEDPRGLTDAELAEALSATTIYPEVEDAVAQSGSALAVGQPTARVLARLVVAIRPKRTLEFGAGVSSLVLARAIARAGGGSLTSIEQMPEWCAGAWGLVEDTLAVDAQLIACGFRTCFDIGGLYRRYDLVTATLAERGPYDLVYVDAPGDCCDGTLHLCAPLLAQGCLLLIDRATEPHVAATVRRWLLQYPGLRPLPLDSGLTGDGIVLRWDTAHERRRSWRATAETVPTYVRFAPRRWIFDLRLRLARSAHAATQRVVR